MRSSIPTRPSISPAWGIPKPAECRWRVWLQGMASVDELLRAGIERLRTAGSETPRLDAELLLAKALRVERAFLIANPSVSVGDGQRTVFDADCERRATGEPVAYIRGFKEFFGLAFAVDKRALIPRPETERIVELAEREVLDRLTAMPRPAGA